MGVVVLMDITDFVVIDKIESDINTPNVFVNE